MKLSSMLVCVLLLGACSEAPVTHSSSTGTYGSSFNGYSYQPGPTSIDDPRMRQPGFYMDGDDSIPWLKAVPQSNR
jgi:hypothetical protein